MKNHKLLFGMLITLVLAINTVGALIYAYNNIYLKRLNSPLDNTADEQRFIILHGETFRKVTVDLQKHGIIRDYRILSLFARLNPDKINIKAGEYLLSAGMSPAQIVRKLVDGDVIDYSITFPEGLTITEMALKWETSGYGTATAFLEAAASYSDEDMNTPLLGWEGYLYPETYTFSQGFTESELVAAMIRQFKKVLIPEWLAAAREYEFDQHKVVILASLIEKETRVPSERTLVSAVFHNRLKKKMLLQCDPTVVYALGDDYSGRLLKKHLVLDLPHNTYVNPGLPPGPIAAPGGLSLEAACFPANVDYLYFVADNTGGHTFSRTLSEHNKAVRVYRRGLKRK
ncbi:endolytic transglycosylase MltG [bacterium]|nr:endolytic transglycosylase MltG [bacterium]